MIVKYCPSTGFLQGIRLYKQAAHLHIWTALFFCIVLYINSFGDDSGLSIMIIGDSNTEYGYITKPLADTLRTIFDSQNSGTGYIPFNSSFYALRDGRYDNVTLRYSSAWTCKDMFEGTRLTVTPFLSPNGHWLTSSTTDAIATVTCSGNGIDMYWLSHNTGGNFSITIDDSLYATITTAGSQSVQKTSLHGLAAGKHTILIKVISVPLHGNVTLLGFDARYDIADQEKRSVVHNWGNGYCTTADFLNIDSTIFVSGLQQCNPDVVVILLGTNDHFQDRRSAPEFKTNCIALIDRIKASGVTANILLTSTFMTNETTGATYLPRYQATAWPEAAAETTIEYWDMCTWFGPYNAKQMNGSVHCNVRGGKLIAYEMLKQIQLRFPTKTSRRTYVHPSPLPFYPLHFTPGMLTITPQNNLPYQINLVNIAGQQIASLQGSGSHIYRLSKEDVPIKSGKYVALLHIGGHTTHYCFTVAK